MEMFKYYSAQDKRVILTHLLVEAFKLEWSCQKLCRSWGGGVPFSHKLCIQKGWWWVSLVLCICFVKLQRHSVNTKEKKKNTFWSIRI